MHREILRLSIPNIITNITVPLLGLVDLAMMGHLGNPVFIGAIALGSTIFNIIYSGFSFLRMGTSGFTAQAFGARQKEEISLILYRSLSVGLVLALLLILLQYPIQWVAFQLLDGSPEVTVLARKYFFIRILAAPATLALYALFGWFLGLQNAKIPMLLAVVINLVNITLNFVFIFGFGMKSDGVAMASVLAQYTGLLLAVALLFAKHKTYVKKFALAVVFRVEALKKFFKVNADIFIRTVLLLLVLAFFTSKSAEMGDDILAVNTLLFQFFFIFSYFADGFAFAGEALAGKATGAGNGKLLRQTVKHLFYWGWGAAIAFLLLFLLGFNPVMHVLTNNKQLFSLAQEYKYWVILLPLTSFSAFIWDGIYIGITASKAMRNSMIVASLLVFLPAYYLSFPLIGNHSLWLALHLFMISRGVLMSLPNNKNTLFKTDML
ncbi:MAG: MATE family efflux transporter [Bacteroidales bacterium]|nr:MATE family efflux transporter [Bacteroidales bacterium]